MAFEKLTESIDDLNDNVKAYAHSNAEYLKLLVFKQVSKSAISLVKFLIVAFSLTSAIAFLSIGLAIAISAALKEPSAGFFIVGGLYILAIGIFIVFGKEPLTRFMLNKFSKQLFDDEE